MRKRMNCFRGLVMLSLFLLIFISPYANLVYAAGPNVPDFPAYSPPNEAEFPEYTPPNVPVFPEYTPPNVPDTPEGYQPNDPSNPNGGDSPGEGSPNSGNNPGDGSVNPGDNPDYELMNPNGDVNGNSPNSEGDPNYELMNPNGDVNGNSPNSGNNPNDELMNPNGNFNSNPSNPNGENSNDPSAYDYAKYGMNGMNDYVGLHADMMEVTGVNPSKAPARIGRSFGRNVLLGIGMNGLNLGLQNTGAANYVEGATDLAEAGFNAYDIKNINTRSTGTFQGGGASSANPTTMATNVAKNPLVKLGTRLNIGTAAVGGTISAASMGKNTYDAFNQNNSYSDRSDAVISGVEDAGNVLMSAGVLAGASGAGAPLGLALAGAGVVLWGGSKLAKWGDKLTGGKVTAGITKGLKAVDAGVNKVKEIASNTKDKVVDGVKSFFGF